MKTAVLQGRTGRSRPRSLPRRHEHEDPRCGRRSRSTIGHPAHPGPGRRRTDDAPLLAELRVPRSSGCSRTRPDKVLADKAYSSRAIRAHLRKRGITSVIPEPEDQKAHRKRRGSTGGRPVILRPDRLPRAQRHRACPQQLQALARPRDPVRQARRRLPRRTRPRRRLIWIADLVDTS
jgi:hypothetical protein